MILSPNLYRNRVQVKAEENFKRAISSLKINLNARTKIINGALRLEAWSGRGYRDDLFDMLNENDMQKKLLLGQDIASTMDKSSDLYKEFMYICLMIFNIESDKTEFLGFFKKWFDLYDNENGVIFAIGKIRITDKW